MGAKINTAFLLVITVLFCLAVPRIASAMIFCAALIYFLCIKDTPIMPEDYDEPAINFDERQCNNDDKL